jgi:hypothetical protein
MCEAVIRFLSSADGLDLASRPTALVAGRPTPQNALEDIVTGSCSMRS